MSRLSPRRRVRPQLPLDTRLTPANPAGFHSYNPVVKYKAAAVQLEPIFGRPDRNVRRILARIEEAARGGAKLVVLPEMANTGYCFASREEAMPYMETVPGPFTRELAAAAARFDCVIVCGLGEVDEESGLFYNTAALVGPAGYIGKYRKVHFFSADAKWAVEGDLGFPVWDTPAGRLGVEVCMDATYPEAGRLLALQGAEVICFPTNWVGSLTPDHRWVSQAFENGVYWIAADRWGTERGLQFMGGSCIVDPDGSVQAVAKSGDAVVYGEIDLDRVRERRFAAATAEDKLKDRRPSLYCEMLQAPYTWSPAFYHRLYGAPGLPEPRTSRVAVLQCPAPAGDVLSRMAAIRSLAAARDFDILVLPALIFHSEHDVHDDREEGLQDVDSLCRLAGELGCLIVSTVKEVERDTQYHTAVLVDRYGVLGTQRACHLTRTEAEWAVPGDGPFITVDTPLGRIGLVTGYDAAHFEVLRVLATRGTDLVCVSSNLTWPTARFDEELGQIWSYWRSKAWESCVGLAYAGYSEPTGPGKSGVWVPNVRDDASQERIADSSEAGVFTLPFDSGSRFIRENAASVGGNYSGTSHSWWKRQQRAARRQTAKGKRLTTAVPIAFKRSSRRGIAGAGYSLNRQGADVSLAVSQGTSTPSDTPPHFSGAVSSRVSVKVHRWPAGSSTAYWRSPNSKSFGSITIRAPCDLACSMWALTSFTRTITEWVTSPARGGCRSPCVSATITAPSPKLSCERWSSPIRTRSTNPNVFPSHSTAARTSG